MTVQLGMAGVEWVVIALGLAVTSPIVLPIRWDRRVLMAVLVPLALAFLAILTCLCMIGWSFRTGEPVFEGVH